MKTYSEKELNAMAQDVFESNKDAQKLHATSDGQFFLESKLNAAQLHAKQKGGVKTPLRIYAIVKAAKKAEPAVEDKSIADMTVKEVTDHVAAINEAEQLKVVLEQVDTKGGRSAVEARISELAAEAAAKQLAEEQAAQKDSPEGRNEGTEGDNQNDDK